MHRKVCIIGPFPPFKGGIPQYNELLAREFSKESDILLLSYKRQYPSFLVKNREQLDKNYKPTDDFLGKVKFIIDSVNPYSWFSTLRKINTFRPDVVILPWWVVYWAPIYIFFLLSFKYKNIQSIFICHNVFEHENNFFKKLFAKIVLKLADKFLVHSESEKSILSNIVSDKLIVKHLIPLFDFDKRKRKRNITNYLGDNKVIRLLFFGSIRKYKGLDLLLESIKKLKDPNVELTIVGDFWDGTKVFMDYINDNKLRNINIINAYIPDESISKYLNDCDVVVLPYISATGSAVIPLAYSYNKPVLVTNVGGLPDTVDHKNTGYICEPKSDSLIEGIQWFKDNMGIPFDLQISKFVNKKMSWSGLVQALNKLLNDK